MTFSRNLRSVNSESSGELSLNSQIPEVQLIVMALSMVTQRTGIYLEEIEDAIDRIFDGTFGICQELKTNKADSGCSIYSFLFGRQTMYEKGTVKSGFGRRRIYNDF